MGTGGVEYSVCAYHPGHLVSSKSALLCILLCKLLSKMDADSPIFLSVPTPSPMQV